MEANQVCQLGPGISVWVWIVRVGKGKWWPGSVLSIAALEPFPIIDTRFECRSTGKNGIDGPAFIGITSTRMRYLELRDPDLRGNDRPKFVPVAIFAKPEGVEVAGTDMQHVDTMTADDRAPRVVSAPPVKKSRARKKANPSIPTQDTRAVAIET